VAITTAMEHEAVVRQAIEAEGLDLDVVTDNDMVLAVPSGTDKATGLAAALGELGLSFHNVVGIGHAESELGFLRRCECAVAVANAPRVVREQCDLGGQGRRGQGGRVADRPAGRRRPGRGGGPPGTPPAAARPYGANVLLAGSSGTGKSKLAAGLLERLAGVEPPPIEFLSGRWFSLDDGRLRAGDSFQATRQRGEDF
jgi:hypothetical protein